MQIPTNAPPVKSSLFSRANIIRIIIDLLILILSSIIVLVGFYRSMPLLMVVGLLFIGLLFIYRFRRFDFKLFVMLITFTYVPAVALLWPLVHHFHFQIVDNSVYRLDSLARSKAMYIDKWVQQREKDFLIVENGIKIDNENAIKGKRAQEIRDALIKIEEQSEEIDEIFIADLSKTVVISTNPSKQGNSVNEIGDIPQDQQPLLTKVFLADGKPGIIQYRIQDINGQKYTVGIKYNLSEIQSVISLFKDSERPESTVKVSLVDRNGFYIFTTDKEIREPLKDRIYNNLDKYLQDIRNIGLHYQDNKGNKTVGSYSTVDSTGWVVIGEQTFREIIYNVDKNSMNVFIMMIVNFVVVLIFAPIFARGITKPILKIRDLAKEGSSGNLGIQIVRGKPGLFEYKEANETIDAFNKMIFTLNELKNSLEMKVDEKTRLADQLKESNEELNAQQEELTYLTDILTKTNQDLSSAYNELKQTQFKLVQHEKMASLGMLVAGVAHEINNPLGAISSNIGIYNSLINKMEAIAGEDIRIKELVKNLESVNKVNIMACERIVQIVKSLRTFARLDEAEFKEADIHEGIDSTLILLNHKIKTRINVVKEYGEIPRIMCYANQLNQVFMNLIANAIDAIRDTGTITIKTYAFNDKVCVMISDTGTGIKPEHLDRIFDPGFTTKGVGVGTGLGLSIVYNIIEAHSGNIDVVSKVGQGTDVMIEIPIAVDNKGNKS